MLDVLKLPKVKFKLKRNVKINHSTMLLPSDPIITLFFDGDWYYTKRPNKENQYGEKEWVGIYPPTLLKYYRKVRSNGKTRISRN